MYNEAKVIGKTATTLHEYLEKNFPGEYEIVFCDDGSRDGSADAVRSLGLDNVRVIGYETNHGKGYAVRTALLDSKGEVALFTDADLAYGCEVIPRFLAEFEKENAPDVVIGSRTIAKDGYEGYTFIRKVTSKIYLLVLRIVGGLKLSDSQCGCKAFSHNAVRSIFSRCIVDRYAFDFEAILLAQKLGLKFREIPVKVINHGDSKVNVIRDTIKMLLDLLKMKHRIKKTKI